MKRYRYILCGHVAGTDKISDFRLISGNNIKPSYDGEVAVRVNIPTDMELTKYISDVYSTTNDQRTLNELGYNILIWYKKKKKWKVHNEFKGINPCDIKIP